MGIEIEGGAGEFGSELVRVSFGFKIDGVMGLSLWLFMVDVGTFPVNMDFGCDCMG